MATTTTNYGLKKPSYNDNADISVINENMDIIDEKMKEIENAGGSVGGSSVEWTQVVTSGTKIAEVNIDGTKTDVYAPTGGGGGGGVVLGCETVIVEQLFENTKDYTFSFTKNFSSIDAVMIGNVQPKASWNSPFLSQVNPFTYDTSAKTVTLNITSPTSQVYNVSIVIIGTL